MGTVRATQLCWAILGILLLQGHHSQPRAIQTSHPQGNFSNPSRTTEPLSSNIGKSLSSDSSSPSSLASTRTQAAQDKASQVLMVTSKPVTPSTSTVDGQSQAQTSTAGLDTTPISTTMSLRTKEDLSVLPSPTSETVLTVAAFGVISFIVILVVVVIVLVSVVSLRFKCRKNKESEDPQKPGSSGISESCSTANGEKDSITLISMKNINMNNSKGYPTAEKVL
ncbi:endothelial cell-specific chemotaxis regulator isoform X1 [Neovison vison]|uniref:Endothelial cell surface expressed chemotaxis and apoptosis regulator n=1 Tax=Neovison vison TaxID=452646 RepID=U6CU39_NEOVI|nr:endothelial cell-specific chemotaxis regulator isoform X1 [Neogale vison]